MNTPTFLSLLLTQWWYGRSPTCIEERIAAAFEAAEEDSTLDLEDVQLA